MGQHGLTASFCGSLGVLRPILNSLVTATDASNNRHGVTNLTDRCLSFDYVSMVDTKFC